MEGDKTSERVPNHMSRVPTLGVHDCSGIIGHFLNGDFPRGCLTAAHSAIVERYAGIPFGKTIDLWQPTISVNADALNEKHWWPVPANIVGNPTALVIYCLAHVFPIAELIV
jgi:hypothetical protein